VSADGSRPILFVDVDGVISVFGFDSAAGFPGTFHSVEGIGHCIAHGVGERLVRLSERFELVWATGWEEKANEYLPFILELPFRDLPSLTFDGRVADGAAHWKLDAIDEYAGDRPAAWVDDNLDANCHAWAQERSAPTLLIEVDPPVGLTEQHVEALLGWADEALR
jgi:hypothetical protein